MGWDETPRDGCEFGDPEGDRDRPNSGPKGVSVPNRQDLCLGGLTWERHFVDGVEAMALKQGDCPG